MISCREVSVRDALRSSSSCHWPHPPLAGWPEWSGHRIYNYSIAPPWSAHVLHVRPHGHLGWMGNGGRGRGGRGGRRDWGAAVEDRSVLAPFLHSALRQCRFSGVTFLNELISTQLLSLPPPPPFWSIFYCCCCCFFPHVGFILSKVFQIYT